MNLNLLRSVLGKNKGKSITISRGSKGNVSISLRVLESLAAIRVVGIKGIQKATVTAVPVTAGVSLRVQLKISQNHDVSSLIESVQHAARDEILEITGVNLQEVQVSIEKVTSSKSRVR